MLLLWKAWSSLRIDDWFDDVMVAGVGARSSIAVRRALLKEQTRARSYAKTVLRTVKADVPDLAPVELLYQRANVLLSDVYERPAQSFRLRMRETAGDASASWDAAKRRLETVAGADLHLASMREQQTLYSGSKAAVGWRRVIHPEMSVSGSCGLCVVASTRFYTFEGLAPMHDGCKCTVAPVVRGNDPGLKLNQADLDRIYETAGSTYAADLRRTRIREVTHGELGPILVPAASAEKGRESWVRPTAATQRQMSTAEIAKTKKWIAALEEAKRTGRPASIEINGRQTDVPENAWALAWHRKNLADLAKTAA